MIKADSSQISASKAGKLSGRKKDGRKLFTANRNN